MTPKDLKKQMFGGFIDWLEKQKIGDIFSMETWQKMMLDNLFKQFEEALVFDKKFNMMMDNMPSEQIEGWLKKKRELELAKVQSQVKK